MSFVERVNQCESLASWLHWLTEPPAVCWSVIMGDFSASWKVENWALPKAFRTGSRKLCCAQYGALGTSRRRTTNHSGVVAVTPSRPWSIHYNMSKQRYITRIYDKIRSKSRPNRATSPTCLHCDVTHLSLTAGVVALHIPSRRVEVREEHRQARKTVWPVNAGRVICPYQNNLCGIINHHKHIWECFYDV